MLGYIVLPLSQIGTGIGRQHWYPPLLWTHPCRQLSVVTATAAPVLPVLSDGRLAAGALGGAFGVMVLVLSVITLLVAAVEGTGLVSVLSGCCLTMSC